MATSGTLIGRDIETSLLDSYINSSKAEFIAIYGRRRIGKTFMVHQHYLGRLDFEATGVIDGEKGEQLAAFSQALRNAGHFGKMPSKWMDAFYTLQQLLEPKLQKGKCIIFIDELPCMDTPKSGFIRALGHFWNSWGQWQPGLKMIVCGSATSWMVENIVDNRAGLHNRLTHEMHLRPFNLSDTEKLINDQNLNWDRLSIAQAYMIMGGVPYYLSLFNSGESLAQGIDRLFFSEDAELRREYGRLFKSLFRNPEPYVKIIETLAINKKGLTRDEISMKVNKADNGHLSQYLNDLVNCDFIRLYNVREKKVKKTSGIYQLTDFFVMFYLSLVENNANMKNFWSTHIGTPTLNTWLGLAFERLCMAHIENIKQHLRIDKISTEHYSWRSKTVEPRVQIDMIIERADRVINICEMKYSESEYTITKEEDLKMRNRYSAFKTETGTRCAIHPVFVTTFGLANGKYVGNVMDQIILDDLF